MKLNTKLFTGQVYIEVVGINQLQQMIGDFQILIVYCNYGVAKINPHGNHSQRRPCDGQCDEDERSGDQRDGRHGGTGRG